MRFGFADPAMCAIIAHVNFTLTDCYCASALGRGAEETLANYLARKAPGMAELEGDVPSRRIRFGMVPGDLPETSDPEFRMRCSGLLALAADGMRSSVERLLSEYGAERVGIVIGASNTGIDEAQRYISDWLGSGRARCPQRAEDASLQRRLEDKPPCQSSGELGKPEGLDFSMIELGTPADYLARITGVKGPAYCVSTACSSSGKAFASARRLIEAGVIDAAITGGVDGRCRFAMNGFEALGALSQGECRPLSPGRDGINLGEGVALFALERGSEGVRLAGVGESSDACHPTAPDPEGRGAEAAMRAAMAEAGWTAGEVDYVNLHGTGTVANDEMELKACTRIFGTPGIGGDFGSAVPRLESTKNLTGHCLGAAGAVEAALCWLLVRSGRVRRALSNSFAFGGSNVCVALA